MAVLSGNAYCQVSNLTGSWWGRLTTVSGGNVTTDQTGWETTPGSLLTLYFNYGITGLLQPGDPDIVRLRVYYETGTGTQVRELHNGGLPADGTSYSFYATDNGLVGGNPIHGTMRLFVYFENTGLGADYVTDSDNGLTEGGLGASSGVAHQGYIRSNFISSLAVSAYPSGSTFAYGPAGNETVTFTATMDGKVPAVRGHEDFTITVTDTGTHFTDTLESVAGYVVTDSLVVNDVNFDNTAQNYSVTIQPVGNSPLTGLIWAALDTDNTPTFNVDPRLTLGTPTLGQTLYNLGEATTIDVGVTNARAEALTRSLNYELKDSAGTTKKSGSDSGANYDINYTLGVSDDAAYDTTGQQWTVRLKGSDQTAWLSDDVFRVSNKLLIGSAAGLNDLVITTDYAVYNRGESPAISYFLSFARGDAYASKTVTATVENEDSQAITTTAGGEVSYTYLIGASDAATSDETGEGKTLAAVHSGNTHDAVGDVFAASSLYFVDLHTQLTGTLNKDDWPNEDSFEDYDFVILGNVVRTWVHVEGVRKDDTEIQTSGSAVQLLVKNPEDAIAGTYNIDTGADGWTSRVDIDPGAPAGDWVYEVAVSFGGNSGADSETITYITPLTSNLQIMGLPPVLAKPNQIFRVWLRTETDGAGDPPQNVPVYRIFDSALNDVLVDSGELLNAVDGTATINGHRYYVDITMPATQGRYLFWAEAQLNGNPIKTDSAFRVAGNGFDPTGLVGGPG